MYIIIIIEQKGRKELKLVALSVADSGLRMVVQKDGTMALR